MTKILIPLIGIFLYSFTLLAQEGHQEDDDHHHDSIIHLGPIQVLGDEEQSDILHTIPTVSNLHGDELLKKGKNSLGETLKDEVGVNSTQFGPNSSRPVIRGLKGDRIRILQNGIGVLDASGTSEDHAVPMNPLASESVEIVRGPISLLYGSSAVGGVVNIVNSRIHKSYFPGVYGGIDEKYESVNQGNSLAGKLDYGVSDWMFHFDGQYTKAKDTDTPLGKIINSETEQRSLAAGTTYFFSRKNYLGLSYAQFENTYGVVSETDVDINLRQRRLDLSGNLELTGFFSSMRLKSAQTFYEHKELEAGETGTIFDNTGNESRVEFVQANRGSWHGVMGLQTQFMNYSAQGEEAFLPSTDKSAVALFAFEEIEMERFKVNLGLRGESTKLQAYQGPTQAIDENHRFFTASAALGGLYQFDFFTSTSLNLSYNERAPTYQELYSNGPHLALGIFEVGQSQLPKETSFAVEWTIKRKTPLMYVALTAFNQEFLNYVSLNPTGTFADTDESGTAGDSPDDFEIFNYNSQKARINGLELEMRHRVHAYWSFRFTADYLYGQNLETNRPLPQISPVRVGLGIQFDRNSLSSSLEWRNVFKQTRIAPQETQTPSYNILNYDLNYDFKLSEESILKLYFQVNNIGDIKARNHVSLLKDRVLLPGRNFVGGLRLLF